MRSLIVARTSGGAESAARFAVGDSLSIVADPLDGASSEQIASSEADLFIIECETNQLQWLRPAMEAIARAAGPGSQILLLFAQDSSDSIEGPVVDAIRGWTIEGATVTGDLVALHATRTTEDVDAAKTLESFRGAQQVAALLRFVANPSRSDYSEFDYESSLAMSNLAQVPRLKADIRALEQQVADSERKLQSRGAAVSRPATDDAAGSNDRADTSGGQNLANNDEKPSSQSRQWKLGILAFAVILTLAAGWAVGDWLDAGVAGFLAVIAVAAVGALAVDVRRRFIGMNRWIRQNAARSQRQLQIQESTSKRLDGVSRAMATSAEMRRAAEDRRRVAEETSAEVRRVAEDVRRVAEEISAEVRRTEEAADERTERQRDATLKGLADAVGRLDGLAASSDAGFSSLRNSIASKGDIARLVRAELLIAYNQLESNMRLRDIVDVTGFTPPLRGWAASPDVIAFLVSEMRRSRPRLVVECGSGASTVWLAMAARSSGLDTQIVALEHDPVFADATSQLLEECGVDQVAEVRLAPLSEVTLGDFTGYWYAPSALEGLADIGLVFVDGPPQSVGEFSRYPALPMMSSKLAPRATVVLDDLVRDEEKRIAERWLTEFPNAAQTVLSVEKGAAVIRFASGG